MQNSQAPVLISTIALSFQIVAVLITAVIGRTSHRHQSKSKKTAAAFAIKNEWNSSEILACRNKFVELSDRNHPWIWVIQEDRKNSIIPLLILLRDTTRLLATGELCDRKILEITCPEMADIAKKLSSPDLDYIESHGDISFGIIISLQAFLKPYENKHKVLNRYWSTYLVLRLDY